jgi:hypothetical protein
MISGKGGALCESGLARPNANVTLSLLCTVTMSKRAELTLLSLGLVPCMQRVALLALLPGA